MKQAKPSSLAPYVEMALPNWKHEADRVVTVQQLMQNRPPALLSTTLFLDESYIIQEMQPTKDSIPFKLIRKQYRDMCQVIDDMGMLTASAQLRSSGRMGSANADALIEWGKSDHWEEPLISYATEYARLTMKNYLDFLRSYKAGIFEHGRDLKLPKAS